MQLSLKVTKQIFTITEDLLIEKIVIMKKLFKIILRQFSLTTIISKHFTTEHFVMISKINFIRLKKIIREHANFSLVMFQRYIT